MESLAQLAPLPAQGSYEDGYEPLVQRFVAQVADGDEIGAGLVVYRHGRCVVDVWGGFADVKTGRPWQPDTRIVVFSVTKGFTAMALNLLSDRGKLEWDAPVQQYWPQFARAGKAGITVRTLFNHRGGLAALDAPLSIFDCVESARVSQVRRALEEQAPAWLPDQNQGYHAQTFGLYASELFERIAGESVGGFLERELFRPLDSDVRVGTPESEDSRMATLYPPPAGARVTGMLGSVIASSSNDARVARAFLARDSIVRRAFLNPSVGRRGIGVYNEPPVRRAGLLWASATASARGIARAYLPFADRGAFDGRVYLRPETLEPLYRRQSWSEQDLVLQKPLGWSQGFLKEEVDVFSPNPESFGHAGMGGALGFCDPVRRLTFGYALNRMDWRVRSPRAKALCRALYACPPIRDCAD